MHQIVETAVFAAALANGALGVHDVAAEGDIAD